MFFPPLLNLQILNRDGGTQSNSQNYHFLVSLVGEAAKKNIPPLMAGPLRGGGISVNLKMTFQQKRPKDDT